MKMENHLKKEIEQNFSQAASTYDTQAWVQQISAKKLGASLRPWRDILPEGPVLEVGCGTGFFTRQLVRLFHNRMMVITDLSSSMLTQCRNNIESGYPLLFKKLDAEQIAPGKKYALISHNFVAQWFSNPAYTMRQHLNKLNNGGIMLAAFPGCRSFPEWREACEQLAIPFTANTLPDVEEIAIKLSLGPHQVDFHEESVTQHFDGALQFFRMLRNIGASTHTGEESLSTPTFKKLLRYWNNHTKNGIKITWHLVFLVVKKDD